MRSGSIAFVAALLIAGLLFGLLRRRWAQRRRGLGKTRRGRLLGAVVALAIAVPVGLILLAKLFDSNVLGWMFGLTLMVGFALLPCGAIFLLGFALGSFIDRRRNGPATLTSSTEAPMSTVRIERDSVHASDEPQTETIAIAPGTTWLALLALVGTRRCLPDISGGEATWVADLRGRPAPVPIGVCAQQWPTPRLLVANGVAEPLFDSAEVWMHFRYLCQQNPDAVFAREAGRVPV